MDIYITIKQAAVLFAIGGGLIASVFYLWGFSRGQLKAFRLPSKQLGKIELEGDVK